LERKDTFHPQNFIDNQVSEIRKVLGEEKAIIACSGGVDSTTCAVLTRKAIRGNLVCIFIDTNFMRLNEPEQVSKTLSSTPLSLPIRVIEAQKRFMGALHGLEDSEDKRKAFRDTFYSVLGETAAKENCHFIVQGTILPDILETVKGIKTQHNVLEQMKINTREVYGFKLIEPLVSLYKPQVREVAKYLGIPFEATERQPFPGPGLSVRVVGKITSTKLAIEKKATQIVEQGLGEVKPKQYFPATFDSTRTNYPQAHMVEKMVSNLLEGDQVNVKVQALRTRATGIRAGTRVYEKVLLVQVQDQKNTCVDLPKQILDSIQRKTFDMDMNVSRILYRLTDQEPKGRWLVAIRAVETLDFVTATVSDVPWHILRKISESILDHCKNVAAVYYDITPKPPASIEFE